MRWSRVISSSLLLPLAAPWAFGQVVVDGDLSDLVAVAQAQRSDFVNDICPLGRSGFDLSQIYVYFDCAADQLFVGLDLMDVPPGIGTPGVGVPGDADGNGNPDTLTNPACLASPFLEQPGVGADEFYILRIDTNGNGSLNDPGDLWVQYRGNAFSILDPNQVPILGASGVIQLGTAGSPVDTAIPDQDENRNTTDIELRIDHWSQLTPTPREFGLLTITGAVFDGLPEDLSVSVLVYLGDEPSSLSGNVNSGAAAIADVLRLNGDAGSFCSKREVVIARGAPIELSLEPAPAGPNPAHYIVWLWSGRPGSGTRLVAHHQAIGFTVHPTPLDARLSPQPFECLRSPGARPAGCGRAFDMPAPQFAPWTLTRPQGVSHPIVITAQGVVEDAAAGNPTRLSVTNAVVLRID